MKKYVLLFLFSLVVAQANCQAMDTNSFGFHECPDEDFLIFSSLVQQEIREFNPLKELCEEFDIMDFYNQFSNKNHYSILANFTKQCAQEIIQSKEYSDGDEKLFNLVEDLDPIFWYYNNLAKQQP